MLVYVHVRYNGICVLYAIAHVFARPREHRCRLFVMGHEDAIRPSGAEDADLSTTKEAQTQRPVLSENREHVIDTLSPGVSFFLISGSGSLGYVLVLVVSISLLYDLYYGLLDSARDHRVADGQEEGDADERDDNLFYVFSLFACCSYCFRCVRAVVG